LGGEDESWEYIHGNIQAITNANPIIITFNLNSTQLNQLIGNKLKVFLLKNETFPSSTVPNFKIYDL
jgi:hypothetical protein